MGKKTLIDVLTKRNYDNKSIIDITKELGLKKTLELFNHILPNTNEESGQVVLHLVELIKQNIFFDFDVRSSLSDYRLKYKDVIKEQLAEIQSEDVLTQVLVALFPDKNESTNIQFFMEEPIEKSPIGIMIQNNSPACLKKMLSYVRLEPKSAYQLLKVAIENNSDVVLSILLDTIVKESLPIVDILQGFPKGSESLPPLAHLTIARNHSKTLELLLSKLSTDEKLDIFSQTSEGRESGFLLQVAIETKNTTTSLSFLKVFDTILTNEVNQFSLRKFLQNPFRNPMLIKVQKITSPIYSLLETNLVDDRSSDKEISEILQPPLSKELRQYIISSKS